MKRSIFNEINKITEMMIKKGLSISQNFPTEQNGVISWIGHTSTSIALKNIDYDDIYHEKIDKSKNYNLKLLDGALIQFYYCFHNNKLLEHKLAFLPNPNLDPYDFIPDDYENDELFLDIISRKIVSFPLHFDYDSSEDSFIDILHPRSHLSLGQHIDCRIPVVSPITPYIFISFIIRNFYHQAYKKYFNESILLSSNKFNYYSITNNEKKILHLNIS